jgi:MATE family multidrug resistance protein
MLLSSFVAALCFFAVFLLTKTAMGNHGLWLAFVIYLAMRGILQTLMMRSRFTSRPS